MSRIASIAYVLYAISHNHMQLLLIGYNSRSIFSINPTLCGETLRQDGCGTTHVSWSRASIRTVAHMIMFRERKNEGLGRAK